MEGKHPDIKSQFRRQVNKGALETTLQYPFHKGALGNCLSCQAYVYIDEIMRDKEASKQTFWKGLIAFSMAIVAVKVHCGLLQTELMKTAYFICGYKGLF